MEDTDALECRITAKPDAAFERIRAAVSGIAEAMVMPSPVRVQAETRSSAARA